MMIEHDKEFDASDLRCPLPVPRLKKILAGMKEGEVLHVIATDPCSVGNILAFADITGNQLRIVEEETGKFHFYIRKIVV